MNESGERLNCGRMKMRHEDAVAALAHPVSVTDFVRSDSWDSLPDYPDQRVLADLSAMLKSFSELGFKSRYRVLVESSVSQSYEKSVVLWS